MGPALPGSRETASAAFDIALTLSQSYLILLFGLKQMETTTLSSRGQVVIPKLLREARNWHAGTSLIVEEVPQGLLLKAVSTFTPSTLQEVLGCTAYRGPALSQADVGRALDADAARQYRKK